MDAVYEGKNVLEWIALLRKGDIAERCAAALALAELRPKEQPARKALVAALNDPEPAVQAAAQAALGLVLHLTIDHRKKMFAALVGPNEETQRIVLQSLWNLVDPDQLKMVPPPEELPNSTPEFVAEDLARRPPEPKESVVPPIDASIPNLPDFTLVHVVPWWLLLGATALCVLLAWVLRGFWWHKWTMLAMAAIAALTMLYAWNRRGTDLHSRKRFRAQARLGIVAVFAAACGFFVTLLFPTGAILIDNESGVNVRLFLDGAEWVSIPSGESKKLSLPRGSYHVSIQAMEKNHVFHAHDIEVAAYGKYVLNVLGGQVYFHGKMQYGGARGIDMKVVQDNWFSVPEVDYLFRDPPQEIVSAHPITKTFFTKGMPPRLRGVE